MLLRLQLNNWDSFRSGSLPSAAGVTADNSNLTHAEKALPGGYWLFLAAVS